MNIARRDSYFINENTFPVSSLAYRSISYGYLLIFFCCFLISRVSYSEGLAITSVSVRAVISEETVLGKDALEEFDAYDVSANVELPWEYDFTPGWDMGSRLMASAGILRGEGEDALVASLIPELTLEREDRQMILDLGVGGALFSRYRFGTQDFGGPFQFTTTLGISVPFYKKLGLGYRYLHYSDASLNGSDTIGADFHMIELSYRP